jgi:hypothetical protein
MAVLELNQSDENAEKQWKSIYRLGGVTTIIVLFGTILDIIIGSASGGNLSALPQTAIDRFAQFQNNWLLGLYNLDLLTIINQIILITTYFALYAAHRKVKDAYAALALIIFLIGTTIFVINNNALPMLELSNKYAASTTESQKNLLASAGEAMLARGAHGSLGVFIGFILPTIAGVIMSFVMLKGKIFSKATAYLGILGNTFMLIYIIFVTLIPEIKNIAMICVMPGGLLCMAWMVMFTIRLFKLGRLEKAFKNASNS